MNSPGGVSRESYHYGGGGKISAVQSLEIGRYEISDNEMEKQRRVKEHRNLKNH